MSDAEPEDIEQGNPIVWQREDASDVEDCWLGISREDSVRAYFVGKDVDTGWGEVTYFAERSHPACCPCDREFTTRAKAQRACQHHLRTGLWDAAESPLAYDNARGEAALFALAGTGIAWQSLQNGRQWRGRSDQGIYRVQKIKAETGKRHGEDAPKYQYEIEMYIGPLAIGEDPNPFASRVEVMAACERHCATGRWR